MSTPSLRASPDFRIAWPLETLAAISREPRQRSALVLDVKSAEEANAQIVASGLASVLVQAWVELFAVVGTESEQVHDALDWVLEEAGAEHVVTSWHDSDDPEDVATFVAASSRASGLTRVVVAVDESTKSGAAVRDGIVKALGVGRDE